MVDIRLHDRLPSFSILFADPVAPSAAVDWSAFGAMLWQAGHLFVITPYSP